MLQKHVVKHLSKIVVIIWRLTSTGCCYHPKEVAFRNSATAVWTRQIAPNINKHKDARSFWYISGSSPNSDRRIRVQALSPPSQHDNNILALTRALVLKAIRMDNNIDRRDSSFASPQIHNQPTIHLLLQEVNNGGQQGTTMCPLSPHRNQTIQHSSANPSPCQSVKTPGNKVV